MDCSVCGVVNEPGNRFCTGCGAALARSCPACGQAASAEANFCGKCGARLAATPAPAEVERVPQVSHASDQAPAVPERRQLTVMFCDLVGSTALSEQLDPEDMRDIISSFHTVCADVVERFHGRIAKFMGDGVLVYFGFPHAHEHDAELAVYAGLNLVEAVRQLPTPEGPRLEVRVGVATGLVVVGDLIGEGPAQEQAVIGETPNLAARLQSAAAPGAVLISASTHRLVGHLFTCIDLGPHPFKGFTQPPPVWEVVREASAEGRFEALHPGKLSLMVGREQELALLLERWAEVKQQDGQVVLLSGEAGIGKSRILHDLWDRLHAEPHTRLRFNCSPHYQNTALYPFTDQLERAAGLSRDDPPKRKLEKLATLLTLSDADAAGTVPLFAALLAIPTDGLLPPVTLDSQRQKELTLEALVNQLVGLAARQPVLMIVEDVHWIDPTSLELLELIIDQTQHVPVLLIITFRPDFRPPWDGYPHVTGLTLNRLGRRQSANLVERLAGKPLPAQVLDQIVSRADGVPLFTEELTKAVLESGLLSDTGPHYELTGPLPPLAIPTTLHDSLMARLDRLSTVKEVAQIGAVIGREFSYEMIAAGTALDDARLQDALRQLVASGLLFRRGTPPHAVYLFKHALVQDVAYGSLLRGRRQQLHAHFAEVLKERFPETIDRQPELLAHHYTQAGLAREAAAYWCNAGQQAIARSATAEAIAHLTKGLELVRTLSDTAATCRLELSIQSTLGGALTAAKGFAAPETGAAYARARVLSEQLDEMRHRVAVLYGLGLHHLYRAEMVLARDVADHMLQLAERSNDSGISFYAHRAAGVFKFPSGYLAEARRHLEQALTLHEPAQGSTPLLLYAFDPLVVCLDYLSRVLLPLGFPRLAVQRSDQALAEARRREHLNTLAFTLFFSGTLHQILGNRHVVAERSSELVSLAAAEAFPIWLAGGHFLQGWGRTVDGSEAEAGLAQMKKGLADWCKTGAEFLVPYFLVVQANCCLERGDVLTARQLLTEASERVELTGECWFAAELHRSWGNLCVHAPDLGAVAAEAAYREALAIARTQGAKLWELRAGRALAGFLDVQGRATEAQDLLDPILVQCADDAAC